MDDPDRAALEEGEEEIGEEIGQFRRGFRSLVLATADSGGLPQASHAPHVEGLDGALFVYLSALAAHTRCLRASGRAGVLFVEPDTPEGNAFARRRLSYACKAASVPRGSREWEARLAAFEGRFGGIVRTLRGLTDFELFRLEPLRGTYVKGFGQAFALEGPGLRRVRRLGG